MCLLFDVQVSLLASSFEGTNARPGAQFSDSFAWERFWGLLDLYLEPFQTDNLTISGDFNVSNGARHCYFAFVADLSDWTLVLWPTGRPWGQSQLNHKLQIGEPKRVDEMMEVWTWRWRKEELLSEFEQRISSGWAPYKLQIRMWLWLSISWSISGDRGLQSLAWAQYYKWYTCRWRRQYVHMHGWGYGCSMLECDRVKWSSIKSWNRLSQTHWTHL